jgi:hypothetical protein
MVAKAVMCQIGIPQPHLVGLDLNDFSLELPSTITCESASINIHSARILRLASSENTQSLTIVYAQFLWKHFQHLLCIRITSAAAISLCGVKNRQMV